MMTKINFRTLGYPRVTQRIVVGARLPFVASDGQATPNLGGETLRGYPERWRLLTAAEACPILGYKTPKALRLAAQQGLVPRVVIGKRVLFDPDALREWARNGGTPLNQSNEPQFAGATA